jgi:multidrug efflux pump subunit AcrA (membrane-fusion protein)
MRNTALLVLSALFTSLMLTSCGGHKHAKSGAEDTKPIISDGGKLVQFPNAETFSFFKYEKAEVSNIQADLNAPARVVATVLPSEENSSQNLVLFDNPDLTSNYTLYIQHLININQIQNINIKQRQIELGRAKDLAEHGAASGKEVLEAQTALAMENTNLNNEKAAIIEHEAKLKLAGFDPELLIHAPAKTVWVISDIPETQISNIKEGSTCKVNFSAYPQDTFNGKIENIGDVVDNTTRMVKLRIGIVNPNGLLRAGMFANVHFGMSEGAFISISKNSLITVQSKNYVFVREGSNGFRLVEVQIGPQVNDRIVVFSGIQAGQEVVTDGTMQLKGMSFGY